jgi:hypothetical protein
MNSTTENHQVKDGSKLYTSLTTHNSSFEILNVFSNNLIGFRFINSFDIAKTNPFISIFWLYECFFKIIV